MKEATQKRFKKYYHFYYIDRRLKDAAEQVIEDGGSIFEAYKLLEQAEFFCNFLVKNSEQLPKNPYIDNYADYNWWVKSRASSAAPDKVKNAKEWHEIVESIREGCKSRADMCPL